MVRPLVLLDAQLTKRDIQALCALALCFDQVYEALTELVELKELKEHIDNEPFLPLYEARHLPAKRKAYHERKAPAWAAAKAARDAGASVAASTTQVLAEYAIEYQRGIQQAADTIWRSMLYDGVPDYPSNFLKAIAA